MVCLQDGKDAPCQFRGNDRLSLKGASEGGQVLWLVCRLYLLEHFQDRTCNQVGVRIFLSDYSVVWPVFHRWCVLSRDVNLGRLLPFVGHVEPLIEGAA